MFCMCSVGQSFPLHFGVFIAGIFNDLAAVAFLPPPHSTFAALRMAAVSPTAKSLKIRSDSANIVTGKQPPPEQLRYFLTFYEPDIFRLTIILYTVYRMKSTTV